jgi:hypothetical protein
MAHWRFSSNISGFGNVAIGDDALEYNDSTGNGTARLNTAVGTLALFSNTVRNN